jgi:hypothetical protein
MTLAMYEPENRNEQERDGRSGHAVRRRTVHDRRSAADAERAAGACCGGIGAGCCGVGCNGECAGWADGRSAWQEPRQRLPPGVGGHMGRRIGGAVEATAIDRTYANGQPGSPTAAAWGEWRMISSPSADHEAASDINHDELAAGVDLASSPRQLGRCPSHAVPAVPSPAQSERSTGPDSTDEVRSKHHCRSTGDSPGHRLGPSSQLRLSRSDGLPPFERTARTCRGASEGHLG